MKKITPIALSAALLLTAVPVNAAEVSESTRQTVDYMMAKDNHGVPNWFCGGYYSNGYEDLRLAFGLQEDKLYRHSLQYGFDEGRLVCPILDVAKYRAAYPDLEEAFGDDWNAYIRHYFEYGIAEGRENFTEFDAADYLKRNPDLQKAFGNDLIQAARHYLEYGYKEGREYKEKPSDVTVTYQTKTENRSENDTFTGDIRWDYDDNGGGYWIETYVNGKLTKNVVYDENGNVLDQIDFDENGNVKKHTSYENGKLAWVTEFYENGNAQKVTGYENGKLAIVFDYDENGNVKKATCYENGKLSQVLEYDAEGNQIPSNTEALTQSMP